MSDSELSDVGLSYDEEEEDYEQDDFQPESSDNDNAFNIDDLKDDDEDDDFEEETPQPRKLSLKLNLNKKPAAKTKSKPKRVIADDEDDEYGEATHVPAAKAPAPKKSKRVKRAAVLNAQEKNRKVKVEPLRSSTTRRAAQKVSYADNFDENDLLEDDEELAPEDAPGASAEPFDEEGDLDDDANDDDDVIPTPDLDAEGLSEDEEEMTYTTDVTKMTERQRARLLDGVNTDDSTNNGNSGNFLSLSNDIQKRRVLTEEENALRRAEIARKRKNLTEKKLEEEKQDTINKLLKRRAGKASAAQLKQDEEDEASMRDKPRRPQMSHPALFTWVSKKEGFQLRVPEPLI